MSTRSPARRAGLGTILLVVVGIAVLLAGAGIIWQHQATTADAPVDLEGNAVSLAPEDTPSEEVVARMDVEPGAEDEDGLVVPSVDLAVPLGTLSAVDGEITPPGFTEAYWVRNLGVPVEEAQDGTVYVVTHSVQDGYAPGNALIDVEAGEARVQEGAEIEVDGRRYTVEGSENIAKTELASQAELWEGEPGRLVLITCLQRVEGRSVDNVVITATLAEE